MSISGYRLIFVPVYERSVLPDCLSVGQHAKELLRLRTFPCVAEGERMELFARVWITTI